MMPGVVAGFPAKPASIIALTSGYDIQTYGYVQEEPSVGITPIGSISPAGASAIPGAQPVPGAPGEIVELAWRTQGQYDNRQLSLVIRGKYETIAQLPFAKLTIGSLTFEKASITWLGYISAFGVSSMTWSKMDNPLPVGPHTITFQ